MPYYSIDRGGGRRSVKAEHANAALDLILGAGQWRWLPYRWDYGSRAIRPGGPGYSAVYSVRRISRRSHEYIKRAG